MAVNGDHKVTLRKQSMALDLGGVAKGAIADRAARLMKQQGIKRGIVDAGGDLVLFNSVGEEPFRVGIKHPERPDTVFAVLSIDNAAVVTSGCYERFENVAGRTICHILDPHTGQPVSGLASARRKGFIVAPVARTRFMLPSFFARRRLISSATNLAASSLTLPSSTTSASWA